MEWGCGTFQFRKAIADVNRNLLCVIFEQVLEGRTAAIRGAMGHAWSNYRAKAWGQDNLLPLSGRGASAGFNHAVTMVDSLDTLWLMGMRAEFNDARSWIAANLRGKLARMSPSTSVFETTIRTLGNDGAVQSWRIPIKEGLGLSHRIASHRIASHERDQRNPCA